MEDKSHSFIVKVWLEESQDESGQAKWRGYVTSVLNGEPEPHYFEDLNNIIDYIVPYLKNMGVKFNPDNNQLGE